MESKDMVESRDGGDLNALKETIGKWLALERTQQEEVWRNVGFDLMLGIAKLSMAVLGLVESQEKRLVQLEGR